MNRTELVIRVPFSGFYHSHLDSFIDDYAEGVLEYDYDDVDFANVDIDYNAIYEAFTLDYAKYFAEHVGLNLVGSQLLRPQFYNYDTDALMLTVGYDGLFDWFLNNDVWFKLGFIRTFVRERLTPCSGFIPFYSADFDSWFTDRNQSIEELLELEIAQVSLVFEAVLFASDYDHYHDLEDEFLDKWLSNSTDIVQKHITVTTKEQV